MASLSITILLDEREEALARPPSGLLLNGTSLQRRRFICEVGKPPAAPPSTQPTPNFRAPVSTVVRGFFMSTAVDMGELARDCFTASNFRTSFALNDQSNRRARRTSVQGEAS